MISVRVDTERENAYRQFAKEQGMSVSEFMRQSADAAIQQAQDILRAAEEERQHEEEARAFQARFEAFTHELWNAPLNELSQSELDDARLARFA